MTYNWNWGILLKDPYFGWIVSGFATTCLIALFSWSIAFPLGSLIGIARTVENRVVRAIATTYVEVFRNVPLLVQLFLWYYVMPELLPADWGRFLKRGLPHPQFWTAVVGLGLYTAARVAEQVRSGIDAIPRGQRLAALAMGLRPSQVYAHVLLPVAYRTIIPPLTSDFLGIFKNSSLALTLGVLELTSQARQIEEYTFQAYEAFICATLLYSAITLTVIALMRIIEARTRIAGAITVGAS
jgi:glutamate/aspartate transport system permease protein